MSAAAFQAIKSLFAPTDEQLMWRVQRHDDAAAFAGLVGRWQAPIQRLCARLTGDPHRAEDLTQEVFSRLFAHRKAYQPDRKFSTYLWRIALNHCYRDLSRARYRLEVPFETARDGEPPVAADFPAGAPAPDETLADRETADAVRRALMELPEHLRGIVVLRHYENLKFREIAEVLDLPEGTVKTRMTEALNELARRLRRTLEMPPAPKHGARPKESLVL